MRSFVTTMVGGDVERAARANGNALHQQPDRPLPRHGALRHGGTTGRLLGDDRVLPGPAARGLRATRAGKSARPPTRPRLPGGVPPPGPEALREAEARR